MASWDESFIRAKYHLSIAKRMHKSFPIFEEKRFIVGVIKELAGSVGYLIKAFLFRERESTKINISRGANKNLKIFINTIAPKYLNDENLGDLLKILEIEKVQKDSPVEFLRGTQIGFLVGGQYKFLRSERLSEFLSSVERAIKSFGNENI
jgi:hypothetical protein